ncbi:MAG: hypothetical protein QXP16_03965 [Candidatus Bathyarchaeia archaeon]
MPIYRSGIDMYRKYEAKFNPTVIGTRFTDVRSLALERAQEGLNVVANVRDLIRPLLDMYGVTGGLRATYLAFGAALLRHVVRQKADTAKKIATNLKSYYVGAYNLDPAVCDDIIEIVVGWAIPY